MGGIVKCAQQPHVPIWVGGKGPIAARRVARYGNGYHTISSTPDEVAAEIALVREECERAGRDFGEIEVSMLGPMVLLDGDPASVRGFPAVAGGSNDEIIDTLGRYSEAGLEHALTLPAYTTPNWDIPPKSSSKPCSTWPKTSSPPCARTGAISFAALARACSLWRAPKKMKAPMAAACR